MEKEKERKSEGGNGDLNFFFLFLIHAYVFHMCSGHFWDPKVNCILSNYKFAFTHRLKTCIRCKTITQNLLCYIGIFLEKYMF